MIYIYNGIYFIVSDMKFVASGGLDNLCSIFNIKDSVGWEAKQPYRELQQHEGI